MEAHSDCLIVTLNWFTVTAENIRWFIFYAKLTHQDEGRTFLLHFKSAILESSRFLEDRTLLLLFPQVSFNLVPEEQHPQLAVRGLVHGLGLHAHAILVWRQLVSAVFLMPQVEEASGRCPDHKKVAVEVLPVQVDVFAAPSFDVDVKASWLWERSATETSSIKPRDSNRITGWLFWYANISQRSVPCSLTADWERWLESWRVIIISFFSAGLFCARVAETFKTHAAFCATVSSRRVQTCHLKQHACFSACMFLMF